MIETNRTDSAPPDIPATASRPFGPGPSILADCARRPAGHLMLVDDLPTARRLARERIPVCPGVYGWLNPDGTVIYVGKAKSLRHRLTGYFATRTSDPKMARIRRHSGVLVWEPNSHELLALIREQELIDRFRPPYNVQGKPERRQPGFVCLSRGVAPTIFFSRSSSPRAATCVGPIAGRGELRAAITSMNYVFQLRDCPERTEMRFSNQLQLFDDPATAACLRYELSSCPAPCAGNCSRQAYHHNVQRAGKFLAGKDATILKRLEERMERAAKSLAFERASVLRDQLIHLKWMDRRVRQLAAARRQLNGIWALSGFDHQQHWMILRGGRLLACTSAPASRTGCAATAEVVGQAAATETGLPGDNLGVNWFLLLASWARRKPEQAKSLISFDRALDRCRPTRACT